MTWPTFALVGYSFGGFTAARFAAEHPELPEVYIAAWIRRPGAPGARHLHESATDVGPGERLRLRILDVHGTRVVISGSYLSGRTSAQDLAEINAIIDSVRFGP